MAAKSDSLPAAMQWEVEVDDDARIRVNPLIRQVVPWLKDLPVEVFGYPGTAGQLVMSPEVFDRTFNEALTSYLRQHPVGISEAESNQLRAARYLSVWWRIKCSLDKTRVAIYIPRGSRVFPVGPVERSMAIVFATGNVVELWPIEKWRSCYDQTRNDYLRVRAEAMEAIGPSM